MTCTHDAETRRDGKEGAAGEDDEVVTSDADRHEHVRRCDPGGDVSSRYEGPRLLRQREREQASPDDPLHRDECGDRAGIADRHPEWANGTPATIPTVDTTVVSNAYRRLSAACPSPRTRGVVDG